MKNVKGFTLIELLVVVLIIGILAAIALPQYQIAVEKAAATEALVNLKTLVGSAERYKLVNGDYPEDFSQLDVSIGKNCSGNGCIHGKFFYYLGPINSQKHIVAFRGTYYTYNTLNLALYLEDVILSSFQLHRNDIVCNTRNKAMEKKVCLALGGKTSWMHVGYLIYVLGR